MEPSVKTHRSPLSAEFWRHCVLSGGTQRRALPRHQSEEMKIKMQVNILSPRVGIKPTNSRFYSDTQHQSWRSGAVYVSRAD